MLFINNTKLNYSGSLGSNAVFELRQTRRASERGCDDNAICRGGWGDLELAK